MAEGMTMYLKNGRFYEGNTEVKPEFGNTEQIKLIEAYRRRALEFSTGVITYPEHEQLYRVSVSFSCLCGARIYREGDADDKRDFDAILTTTSCPRCYQKYKIIHHDKDTVKITTT